MIFGRLAAIAAFVLVFVPIAGACVDARGSSSSSSRGSSSSYSSARGSSYSAGGRTYGTTNQPGSASYRPTWNGSYTRPAPTYRTETLYRPSNATYWGLPIVVRPVSAFAQARTATVNGRTYRYAPNSAPAIYSNDRAAYLYNGPRRVYQYRAAAYPYGYSRSIYQSPYTHYHDPFFWYWALYSDDSFGWWMFAHPNAFGDPFVWMLMGEHQNRAAAVNEPVPQTTEPPTHHCAFYDEHHRLVHVDTIDACPTPAPDTPYSVKMRNPDPEPDAVDEDK